MCPVATVARAGRSPYGLGLWQSWLQVQNSSQPMRTSSRSADDFMAFKFRNLVSQTTSYKLQVKWEIFWNIFWVKRRNLVWLYERFWSGLNVGTKYDFVVPATSTLWKMCLVRNHYPFSWKHISWVALNSASWKRRRKEGFLDSGHSLFVNPWHFTVGGVFSHSPLTLYRYREECSMIVSRGFFPSLLAGG